MRTISELLKPIDESLSTNLKLQSGEWFKLDSDPDEINNEVALASGLLEGVYDIVTSHSENYPDIKIYFNGIKRPENYLDALAVTFLELDQIKQERLQDLVGEVTSRVASFCTESFEKETLIKAPGNNKQSIIHLIKPFVTVLNNSLSSLDAHNAQAVISLDPLLDFHKKFIALEPNKTEMIVLNRLLMLLSDNQPAMELLKKLAEGNVGSSFFCTEETVKAKLDLKQLQNIRKKIENKINDKTALPWTLTIELDLLNLLSPDKIEHWKNLRISLTAFLPSFPLSEGVLHKAILETHNESLAEDIKDSSEEQNLIASLKKLYPDVRNTYANIATNIELSDMNVVNIPKRLMACLEFIRHAKVYEAVFLAKERENIIGYLSSLSDELDEPTQSSDGQDIKSMMKKYILSLDNELVTFSRISSASVLNKNS